MKTKTNEPTEQVQPPSRLRAELEVLYKASCGLLCIELTEREGAQGDKTAEQMFKEQSERETAIATSQCTARIRRAVLMLEADCAEGGECRLGWVAQKDGKFIPIEERYDPIPRASQRHG